MANPSTAHEPSMEEILASIRQIISEDGDRSPASAAESARQEAPAQPPAGAEPDREPPYETVVSRLESEPASAPMPPVTDPPRTYQEPARGRAPEPAASAYRAPFQPRALAAPSASHNEEAPLLSPEKGAAISGAFGALAHTILAQNSRTLEDVVGQMLQPMLKSWLDDNLPALVERMVKEEIERVSRGRR